MKDCFRGSGFAAAGLQSDAGSVRKQNADRKSGKTVALPENGWHNLFTRWPSDLHGKCRRA